MNDRDDAAEVVAGVMSRIADKPIRTYRWGITDEEENQQVPVYWMGDPATAGAFGAFPKSAGPPTIKRLKKWLRQIGVRPLPKKRGKGSHERWELPDGTQFGFATSAGFLLPPEAAELASAIGTRGRSSLSAWAAWLRFRRPLDGERQLQFAEHRDRQTIAREVVSLGLV